MKHIFLKTKITELNENRYISHEEILKIKSKYKNQTKCKNLIYRIINNRFLMSYKNLERVIDSHNNTYIKYESNNKIFENINGYKLDKQQKTAILTNETNTLVIAGAGSGKSLTIIGKIVYLVNNKHIEPSKILCMSLTNEATNNLKNNLIQNQIYGIQVKTFHKLSYDIIRQYNQTIKISSENTLSDMINEYFEEIRDNQIAIKDIVKYFVLYNGETIQKNININNKNDCLIANYLYLNSINYKYILTETKSIFKVKNTQIIIYHKNTQLKNKDIEFHDIDFITGDILKKLKKQLQKRKIKLIDIDYNKLYNTINKDYIYQLKKLISVFITLFKSNSYTIGQFDIINKKLNKIKNKVEKNREKIFLYIVENIYSRYEYKLKANQEIDFNDMINIATSYIRQDKIKVDYEYIIIDEYQDTSNSKYLLLKSIKEKNNSKLFVVGDDFQSIYGFTGCTLDIFLNFKNYFGYTKTIILFNTYRNSQELIDIAGKFIMKNKYQIEKKLISSKHIDNPIKCVYYTFDFNKQLENVISQIQSKSIMILGRNNKDIAKINSESFIIKNNTIIYKKDTSKSIEFKTVHKSKGLEDEDVIIINMDDKSTGFPNKIIDDKVLRHVKNTKEYYEYEEERRLFYVALTRCKNRVYLMIDSNSKSIFAIELEKYINK